MSKPIKPVFLIIIAVVAVALLGAWGYHAVQPAPYLPSPGAGGRPGATASQTSSDGGHPPGYYPTAPAGAIPGSVIPPQGGQSQGGGQSH